MSIWMLLKHLEISVELIHRTHGKLGFKLIEILERTTLYLNDKRWQSSLRCLILLIKGFITSSDAYYPQEESQLPIAWVKEKNVL